MGRAFDVSGDCTYHLFLHLFRRTRRADNTLGVLCVGISRQIIPKRPAASGHWLVRVLPTGYTVPRPKRSAGVFLLPAIYSVRLCHQPHS